MLIRGVLLKIFDLNQIIFILCISYEFATEIKPR